MDVELARLNMIEQQIRPWDVLDQSVLDLLYTVRREEFVPPQLRALAFADIELPLRIDGVDTGEVMMAPKVEARLLQELGIQAHEMVLEVGTGSGYMAALAAHRAHSVLSIEIDRRLASFGEANLIRAGVRNVRVEFGDGALGWSDRAPYHVIIMSGSEPVPLGALSGFLSSIDPERPIVCICHHGTRSMHAGLALERYGCREIYNLVGGVDAWARQIDRSMATY